MDTIRRHIRFDNMYAVDVVGRSGGLCLFWKNELQISILNTCNNWIIAEIMDASGKDKWWLGSIYATTDDKERAVKWSQLQDIINRMGGCGVMVGDFNDIVSNREKDGGQERGEWSFRDFRRFISSSKLIDLNFVEHPFTWCNKRPNEQTVMERLDWALSTSQWRIKFPNASLFHLIPVGSDHCPVLLDTEVRVGSWKKPFYYDPRWADDPSLRTLIKEAWGTSVYGSRWFCVDKKLKRCRSEMARWKRQRAVNSRMKIDLIKGELHQAHIDKPFDNGRVKMLERELGEAWSNEEEYWKLKSRIQWLQLGDRNTAYFHAQTIQRRSRNKLVGLEDSEGQWRSGGVEVKTIVADHFGKIFKTDQPRRMDVVVDAIKRRVTARMNEELVKPFAEEEIKDAIFGIAANKSPGPDGLTAAFYHQHWDLIGGDIIRAVQSFHHSGSVMSTRGLRQGDPLSPYLFLICGEALTALLRMEEERGNIQGVKISRQTPSVSHLMFADDTIIFCRANYTDCRAIKSVLKQYGKASGQQLNVQKSSIFFCQNTPMRLRNVMCRSLEIFTIGGQGMYLGLPTIIGQSKRALFESISSRVEKKVQGWEGNFLSKAGKKVLLKSVTLAIPNYAMSCFKLSVILCHGINSTLAQFWWSKKGGKRSVHWLSWRKLGEGKLAGRMGFYDLETFNKAMVAKQGWKLISNPDTLLSQIIKGKYYPRTGFMKAKIGARPSWAWRSILWARPILEYDCRWSVGDGRKIKVWSDPWLPKPITFKPQPRNPLHIKDYQLRVADLICPILHQWNSQLIDLIFSVEDGNIIRSIPLAWRVKEDKIIWHMESQGQYTVSSGYKNGLMIARNGLTSGRGTGESSNGQSRVNWKEVWVAKVPNKLRTFL